MSQYMMLVYEAEVDPAVQAERERELPLFVKLHHSLREAGVLVGVQRLRTVESATTVRVRDGETEIVDLAVMDAIRVSPKVTRQFEADAEENLVVIAVGARHKGDGEVLPGWWQD